MEDLLRGISQGQCATAIMDREVDGGVEELRLGGLSRSACRRVVGGVWPVEWLGEKKMDGAPSI